MPSSPPKSQLGITSSTRLEEVESTRPSLPGSRRGSLRESASISSMHLLHGQQRRRSCERERERGCKDSKKDPSQRAKWRPGGPLASRPSPGCGERQEPFDRSSRVDSEPASNTSPRWVDKIRRRTASPSKNRLAHMQQRTQHHQQGTLATAHRAAPYPMKGRKRIHACPKKSEPRLTRRTPHMKHRAHMEPRSHNCHLQLTQ